LLYSLLCRFLVLVNVDDTYDEDDSDDNDSNSNDDDDDKDDSDLDSDAKAPANAGAGLKRLLPSATTSSLNVEVKQGSLPELPVCSCLLHILINLLVCER